MASYFLESSAAAKLYIAERGTDWMRSLANPAHGNSFTIVHIALVEIAAAMFRRVRGGSLSLADATVAMTEVRRDVSVQFSVVDVTASLISAAIAVAERHGLRGYDCIHLAALMSVQQMYAAAGIAPPVLLSADRELNAAAIAEGFNVEDPNSHP